MQCVQGVALRMDEVLMRPIMGTLFPQAYQWQTLGVVWVLVHVDKQLGDLTVSLACLPDVCVSVGNCY